MLKKDEKKVNTEEVTVKETVSEPVKAKEQEIEVGDPLLLRPTELPLVVKLPADASEAQIAYAKILNSYAYQNPTKWEQKKDDKIVQGAVVKGFITKLKELKNAPAPRVDGNLKINNSLV